MIIASEARAASRSQTVQGDGRGACQHDGAHWLGIAGQGWHLLGYLMPLSRNIRSMHYYPRKSCLNNRFETSISFLCLFSAEHRQCEIRGKDVAVVEKR